ncbi:MAG TPA: cytochrome b/b6 domain-containing protein [Capsulimonadaceae bacterium]|jgi:thiosulfate reductase cytochrome b subunit
MKRLEKKHPLFTRWNHWVNFPVLTVMICSGLLIYWADDVQRIGLGSVTLVHMKLPDNVYEALHMNQRLAAGMAWHFAFMWLFALNGALYVLYTLISGEWRNLIPTRRSFSDAIEVVKHDLGIRKQPLPATKYNGAQRIAYSSIILMGIGSLITGLAIYKPVQLSLLVTLCGGFPAARFLHFWLTMGYIAFFVVHIVQVARAGWSNFRGMVTGYEVANVESAEGSRP